MSHFVYILYSSRLDKYYVGKSANPHRRLQHHNSVYNKIWTKRGQPWEIKLIIEFQRSSEASKVEVYIKRQRSRKYIEELINYGYASDPD